MALTLLLSMDVFSISLSSTTQSNLPKGKYWNHSLKNTLYFKGKKTQSREAFLENNKREIKPKIAH